MIRVEKSDLLVGQFGATGQAYLDALIPYKGSHAVKVFETPEQESLTTLAVVAHDRGGRKYPRTGAEALVRMMIEVFDQTSTSENVPGLLERGFVATNPLILQMEEDVGVSGVAVAIVDRRLYVASLGDCRVFWVHSGKCIQISVAHTIVEQAVEKGAFSYHDVENGTIRVNSGGFIRGLGVSNKIAVDLRLRLGPNETDAQAMANQGMMLNPGDLIILINHVFGEYVTPKEWELLNASFANEVNNSQMAVNQFVENLRQQNYGGDLTIVALKVPDEK